ncbi:MAG: cytochrome P450, partial [Pseudomonadales bacterium]|nr:cytochrome P450 [Pseudomonadales bacterium]
MSEASKVPVFDLQNLIDPYPMYKQLRDEAPVYHVPELNMYYVTSYELLRHVIRDTKTYSSQYDDFMAFSRDAGLANLADGVREEITNKMREMIPTPPTMLTLDEPDHTKYRS